MHLDCGERVYFVCMKISSKESEFSRGETKEAIWEHSRLEHKCINDQQVSPEHMYRETERERDGYAPCARGGVLWAWAEKSLCSSFGLSLSLSRRRALNPSSKSSFYHFPAGQKSRRPQSPPKKITEHGREWKSKKSVLVCRVCNARDTAELQRTKSNACFTHLDTHSLASTSKTLIVQWAGTRVICVQTHTLTRT